MAAQLGLAPVSSAITTQLNEITHLEGAAAVILSIGLVPMSLTQAQAATVPTPRKSTIAPITSPTSEERTFAALKNLTPAAPAQALRVLGQSTSTSSLATVAPGTTQLSSTCPTGQALGAVYGKESVETGFSAALPNDGFTLQLGAGAPTGPSSATCPPAPDWPAPPPSPQAGTS